MKIKYIILASILSVTFIHIAHAESNIEKYKKNYIEQIIPVLNKQFSEALATEDNPDAKLKFIAEGMADCQIETLTVYPQKYQDATINPVSKGADLGETSKQVNEIMKADLESGSITEGDFMSLLETATEKYTNCTKALEKQL